MSEHTAFVVFVSVFCGALGLVTLLMLAAALGLFRRRK